MPNEREDRWALFLGIGLVALGAWLLVERVAGPLLEPVRQSIRFVQGVGWPLAVILLGILLIIGFPRISGTQLKGRRLYKSRTEKMVAGVLGGVADYIGADPTWVRLGYILFSIVVGFGPAFGLYIIAAIVVPKEPEFPEEIVAEPVFVTNAAPAAPAPPVPPIPDTKPPAAQDSP